MPSISIPTITTIITINGNSELIVRRTNELID